MTSSAGASRQRGKPKKTLAVAPAERQRRLRHEERHVTAESRGELEQFMSGHGIAGELIHGEQCGGTVARATAESGRTGIRLTRCSLSPNRRPVASRTWFAARTTVFSAAGPGVTALDRQCDGAALDALGDQGVVQVEQGEDRLEAVITVVFAGQHTERAG